MVSIIDSNSMRSLQDWSDSSSSSVEEPPLFHVPRSIAVLSDVVSITSNVLSHLECMTINIILSDSELNVVTEWLSSISEPNLVNIPIV